MAASPRRKAPTEPDGAAKLRAWWAARQGLDGSLEGKGAAEVLQRSGWARSVGGVGPYLTLFARAGIGRAAADAAVARLEIHELPAARGCTYVVPSSDFALALQVGRALGGGELKTALRLGVTEKEIAKLCDAVLEALVKGPLDPDGIREATGKASRSLGEEGKKKGLTTTLPVALGQLQGRGEIRRVPSNGRLDQQRYQYALWKPNPLVQSAGTEEAAYRELARRFFRWVGPARLGEFQWFSGLGVKASKEVAPLELVPISEVSRGPIGGTTEETTDAADLLLLPDDAKAFASFEAPAEPRYALVSSLDALCATRREIASLIDGADRKRKVQLDRQAGELGGFYDLPHHAIFDRGRLVGFWEYDSEARELVWASFGGKNKALEAAVQRTEAYLRDELGDARAFSLDNPKSRAPRIEAVRKLR